MISLLKNRFISFFLPFALIFTAFTSTVNAAEEVNCEALYAICLLMGANLPMCSVFYISCLIFGV
ncbi:MAG: hypothetical protein CMF23_14025 [Ignavibacteriae bacterium]|nr:hypothetical protein [Ignavibacteriota bacterium]